MTSPASATGGLTSSAVRKFDRRAASRRSGVEVEHPAALLRKGGVARKGPRARLPRLDRVHVQPAPDRRRRRVRHAALHNEAMRLNQPELRERQPAGSRQLARDRLDLGDLLRGGERRGRPARGLSFNPSSRSWKNRLRHFPRSPRSYPTPGDLSVRHPLSRCTSRKGNFSARARHVNSTRSCSVSSIRCCAGRAIALHNFTTAARLVQPSSNPCLRIALGGPTSGLSMLDSAGRRRSPATLPGYHAGRTPSNTGMRYPADPPTVEEIVAVMRHPR
jgi:hypothetical protein